MAPRYNSESDPSSRRLVDGKNRDATRTRRSSVHSYRVLYCSGWRARNSMSNSLAVLSGCASKHCSISAQCVRKGSRRRARGLLLMLRGLMWSITTPRAQASWRQTFTRLVRVFSCQALNRPGECAQSSSNNCEELLSHQRARCEIVSKSTGRIWLWSPSRSTPLHRAA